MSLFALLAGNMSLLSYWPAHMSQSLRVSRWINPDSNWMITKCTSDAARQVSNPMFQ
jgi:hypothetical protein